MGLIMIKRRSGACCAKQLLRATLALLRLTSSSFTSPTPLSPSLSLPLPLSVKQNQAGFSRAGGSGGWGEPRSEGRRLKEQNSR